jgi:hypothetical protein
MSATRAALERLVWESLPEERRETDGVGRFAVSRVATGKRYDDLAGLTEPELLALLPPQMRKTVTARLNGEEPMGAPKKAAARPPAAEGRPGPRKSGPKRASKKREAG